MKILTSVLKDREIQNYIQENEDSSFEYLKNSFNLENMYNYVVENVGYFVVENDSNSSYENIKNFSKNYMISILNENIDPDQVGNTIDDATGHWQTVKTFFSNLSFRKMVEEFQKSTSSVSESLRNWYSNGVDSLSPKFDSFISGVVPSTTRGKIIAGSIAAVLSFFGGAAAWYKFGGKSLESVQGPVASLADSAADAVESNPDNVVDLANNTFESTGASTIERSSFYNSFISFCDSAFEKLSSSASNMWNNARELADQHPNIAYGILIISALGIVYSFSRRRGAK